MIETQDIPGFFADRTTLDLSRYVMLRYRFETDADPKFAAASLCSEQSTAQWHRPGSTEDLRPQFAAKVVALNAKSGVVDVTIAHPWENFGAKLPNLIAAVAGEGAFYAPMVKAIKLMDIEFPDAYLKQFEGPQFGIKGSRDIFKIEGRPFFIGVVKPNLGLPPEQFAELAYESWVGGLDIAKDDEMLGDMTWSPLADRARAAGLARRRAEKETGTPKCYLACISDEVYDLPSLYKTAVENGANAVMINPICTGISAARQLRRISEVPVMGHFAGVAVSGRVSNFGVASVVWTKLMRLAGCDWIGIAGFGPRMQCSDEEVMANVRACWEPMGNIAQALPIPGGSDTAETLPMVAQKVGSPDFGFISGRGVFGHEQGPRAGATSLHQAWKNVAPI
ncbi:MAG: ribulose 1,5-bisphosphate carboxylase [Deltaproteobacteria bacterium CG11_big_fil_rev_8_21_14_0_20_47_16]|nr:MAG: ribulose 1,5-bisphosphate carboxylase [Deltaproteobacteria bacterium CG11_big_fil_rev_8_21_14_0_20_47_16]